MKKIDKKNSKESEISRKAKTGLTLIETIIYIVLLSFLMSSFIQYVYIIHQNNIQLINEIQEQSQP